MADYGLGRIGAVDARDDNFPMRMVLPATVEEYPAYKTWPYPHPRPLDQGNTGTCVGHGWKHQLMAAPGPRQYAFTDPTALTIYREACVRDPWSENDDGNLQFGTSVRAGAEALRARGLITGYVWAQNFNDVLDHLLLRGPVVLGLDWYETMFYPDAKGYIKPEGGIVGGHCLLAIGITPNQHRIRLLNSWGADWGQNGRAWIEYNDLEMLLDMGGEACATVEPAV